MISEKDDPQAAIGYKSVKAHIEAQQSQLAYFQTQKTKIQKQMKKEQETMMIEGFRRPKKIVSQPKKDVIQPKKVTFSQSRDVVQSTTAIQPTESLRKLKVSAV